MTTTIDFRILNREPLLDYKQACKITKGEKLHLAFMKKPKDEVEYWVSAILANHSTLRAVRFRMTAKAPKSVIMQLIRATKGHPQPYVQSSRPDWTGKERSADPYEEKLFIHDHTAESFVQMASQRLCMKTEKMTREFAEKARLTLIARKEPFLRAVGLCCLPPCAVSSLCPELTSCGRFPRVKDAVYEAYRTAYIESEG